MNIEKHDNSDINVRPLTDEEQKYTYSQGLQLEMQTGSIGHFKGGFGECESKFDMKWTGHQSEYKTKEFRTECYKVINKLCSDKYGLLKNRLSMKNYIKEYKDSAFRSGNCMEYGFRVDTEKFSYLIRCNPVQREDNFYFYCFRKECLDRHMEKARQGIRFITPAYEELFHIPDAGSIVVSTAWGKKSEYICRYIDEYHTEIGGNLYHICEFAECMQADGATYEEKKSESMRTTNHERESR